TPAGWRSPFSGREPGVRAESGRACGRGWGTGAFEASRAMRALWPDSRATAANSPTTRCGAIDGQPSPALVRRRIPRQIGARTGGSDRRGLASGCLESLDLYAVVVEDRSTPHVGVTLVDGGVDGCTALHEAGPSAFRARHHAPADAIGDLDPRDERAAVVEDA